ncbi:MAG: ribbon-helix-helix protein, CopG family [Acidobacteria bacterium]|nr:ribbon-helix-helix protein, CopG family [Acidobacteriota bacterium]
MLRTQIQLSDEQLARVKRTAAERGVSVAQVVRDALEAWMCEAPSLDGALDRALSAAGRFHSGHRDVSERHDRHLAEILSDDLR